MKIDLSGKVAIVTGAAGKGLGRGDALALGRSGAAIAVVDIADPSEAVAMLKAEGIKAAGFICDISNVEAVNAAVAEIVAELGEPDILINNASILTTVGMFCDIPIDKWNRDIGVNLIGSANVTRAVWPYLLKKKWGRVIFMSSIAGTRGGAGQTSYAATKAAVIGLAKSLAMEGARANITVNCIAPGVMQSEAAINLIRPDMLERMKARVPSRQLGTVENIADTVTFLCSPQALYITGQVLEVDGGSGLFIF
jgi:NAD(P)-dependent dehydrogenase (short-subunit alcohol dehydrogenase family)